MRPARRLLPLAAIALTAAMMAPGAIAKPTAGAVTGPGCDPARPAIAHHAGGAVLRSQPPRAPIPCMTFTGPTTDSASIGVTDSGTVFYAPIEQVDPDPVPAPAKGVAPTVVARSTDQGAHWDRVVPGTDPDPVSPHGALIDWLSVDPQTSRVWYATPTLPCGATVSWSDDEGATWQTNPNTGCPAQGGNALIEGPPPPGGEQPLGYPHVVYYCANAGEVPLGDQSFLVCHRSLDGGLTFETTGSSPDQIPPRSECGTVVRETRTGIVGHDGSLYFPQNVCGAGNGLRLAISGDEGKTWHYSPIVRTEVQDLYPPAIAADADNDLFLAWKGAGGLPYLTISRDQGASWSKPMQVGAPGVTQIQRLALTSRQPNHISVSYLGSTDGGNSFNAYITTSWNALAPDPTFWSASVNDPATPVALASNQETFGDRIQFLTGMIGADGTPWAAFHCARTPLCPDRRVGIAARLRVPARGSRAPG